MEEGVNDPEDAGATSAKPKRGYSILSLVVILVLLVVWQVLVPKHEAPDPRAGNDDWFMYIAYKAGFWALVVALFWIVFGKRALESKKDSQGRVVGSTSIWTILVFTGLLALWLIIPRQTPYPQVTLRSHLFLWHQLAIWTWLATLVWLFTRKSRLVLSLSIAIILVVWLPLLAMNVEYTLTRKHRYINAILPDAVGKAYYTVYRAIYYAFGYGPKD